MQTVKLIYNPASGEKGMETYLDRIIRIYQRKGFQIIPYRLRFDKDIEEDILFGVNCDCHHVLIAGGDGTVNYVINILMKNNMTHIPVGLLPVGTANDFSRNIGMSTDIDKSCRRILSGKTIDADLGMVNGHYFVNVLGVGLFSDLSLKTPTILKNYFGKMAYYMGGIGELAKLRKLNISLHSDGGDFDGECYLILVLNGKTAGSLRLAHSAEITDGKLDVLIVRSGAMDTLQNMIHYLSPLYRKRRNTSYSDGITHIQCSQLFIDSKGSEKVDIDGEMGPGFPLEIECCKSAFKLIVPGNLL